MFGALGLDRHALVIETDRFTASAPGVSAKATKEPHNFLADGLGVERTHALDDT